MSRETALASLKETSAASISNVPPAAPSSVASGETAPPLGGDGGGAEKTNSEAGGGEDLQSSRFAAIAKREAKLVKDREEWAKIRDQEKAEIEKLKGELKEKLTPIEKFQVMRSQDPVAALKELGFSDTDIINFMAQSEKRELTPEEKAKLAAQEEIEKFRREEAEKAAKAETERNDQIISKFRSDIKAQIQKEAEKYEFCAFYDDVAVQKVFDHIEKVAKETQELIPIEQALAEVEAYYEEEDRLLSEKVKKRNKGGVVGEEKKEETKTDSKKEEKAPPPPKTLTNAATATVAGTAKVEKTETRAEKRARLAEALRRGSL